MMLGNLEEMTMLTVAYLGDYAYSTRIQSMLEAATGTRYSIGCVHTTLKRLTDKDFVASTETEPTKVRGGRRKRQYRITTSGHVALVRLESARMHLRRQR